MIDIMNVIKKGENQFVEFKTSFSKEVIETVVAFSNAKGGTIVIGVDDNRKVVGVITTPETIQNHINTIKQNTQPNILVDIEVIDIEEKIILIIEVKEYPLKPVAFRNRYYKRIRNSNHLMSLDEIANEHLKTINSSWDFHIDDRHDFSDISQDNIVKFIQKVEKNLDKTFNDDPMTILRKYELIKENKLTFGAYLLFTSNNSPITSLQIGRFKDPITIIDNIDIDTNLIDQVDMTLDGIKKHLMTEFIITGEPQRTVRYDYPLEAIREIVINMIVHRDYTDSGNSIIKIFDDHIEFFNPGKLYGDITIEKLHSGDYSSRTRNRAIANAFKEAGIIERYGSGIQRIKDECRKYEIKEPIFEEFVHGFRVIIYKEKLNEGVNEGVKSLYELIKSKPNNRSTLFVQELNTSVKNIERWLKQLKKEKKIEFRGAPKTGGYWSIDE